jgi:hypothetical protein
MQFSHQALLLCYLTVSQGNSSDVKGEFVRGTPLSPVLFVLAAELLQILIN